MAREIRALDAGPCAVGQTANMDAATTPEPVDGAMGRWFEELPVGLVVRHALTRTVIEADNPLFCALTHNPQPMPRRPEVDRYSFSGIPDTGCPA